MVYKGLERGHVQRTQGLGGTVTEQGARRPGPQGRILSGGSRVSSQGGG